MTTKRLNKSMKEKAIGDHEPRAVQDGKKIYDGLGRL